MIERHPLFRRLALLLVAISPLSAHASSAFSSDAKCIDDGEVKDGGNGGAGIGISVGALLVN
jgi:hypothetical protein